MSNGIRAKTAAYPQMVFLKRGDGTGHGFMFRSKADFDHAAELFFAPILHTTQARGLTAPDAQKVMRMAAADKYVTHYFLGQLEDEFGRDTLRWLAAAYVADAFAHKLPEGTVFRGFPWAVTVGFDPDEAVPRLRPGLEFLEQAGYPRAVVVGRPDEGGGIAHFFESEAAYAAAGETPASDDMWLPQILYRLYARTASVMMGAPFRTEENGKTSVSCFAVGPGADAALRERGGS